MKHILPLIAALFSAPATAQDLEGNDTASNWRATHYVTHGIYVSACDERPEAGELKQRCYIRYVDVFSGRPDFAAQFMFVTSGDEGEVVDFGIEPGTFFSPNGFRIENGEEVTWRTRRPGCLTGLSCTFEGDDAAALIEAMQGEGALRFTFRDRHGVSRDLSWPLDGFDAALDDFHAQSAARGL